MRLLRAFIAIVFLAAGIVLGALNPELSTVDLGIARVQAGLGVILLCTLLAGVLMGGLVIATSVVLPLRRELRRNRAAEPSRLDAAAFTPATTAPLEP
jgi:lipopolysaccharide assembly protein A